MGSPKPTLNLSQPPGHPAGGNGATISAQLLAKARVDSATLLQELASRLEGLTQAEADARFKKRLNTIRNFRTHKIPFIQSRASWPLIATSLIIVAVGAWLTVSPLAGTLGFVPLPPLYWLLLAIMLPCYVILTQVVKTWFYRRFGE
jgi:hypothetical protein